MLSRRELLAWLPGATVALAASAAWLGRQSGMATGGAVSRVGWASGGIIERPTLLVDAASLRSSVTRHN